MGQSAKATFVHGSVLSRVKWRPCWMNRGRHYSSRKNRSMRARRRSGSLLLLWTRPTDRRRVNQAAGPNSPGTAQPS